MNVAVIGIVGSTHSRLLGVSVSSNSETNEGAFLLTQALLQIVASRVAMEPSVNFSSPLVLVGAALAVDGSLTP
jgi:hypothetical protein